MADESGFEILEHTADVAVHAWAPDFEGLMLQLLKGLQTVVFGRLDTREPATVVLIEWFESNLEDAVVALLNEAVFQIFHNHRVPVAIGIAGLPPAPMKVSWSFAPADFQKMPLLLDIKAATYHNLKVEHNGHCEATVVFDI